VGTGSLGFVGRTRKKDQEQLSVIFDVLGTPSQLDRDALTSGGNWSSSGGSFDNSRKALKLLDPKVKDRQFTSTNANEANEDDADDADANGAL